MERRPLLGLIGGDLLPAASQRKRRWKTWLWLGLIGVLFAADLLLGHLALVLTSIANAVLEMNFASVFVVLLGWIFLNQKPNRTFIFALILALSGAALLVGQSAKFNVTTIRGDVLAWVTALFYANYLLSIRKVRRDGVSSVQIMAVSAAVSGVFVCSLLR